MTPEEELRDAYTAIDLHLDILNLHQAILEVKDMQIADLERRPAKLEAYF